jgi:hypothetical protein
MQENQCLEFMTCPAKVENLPHPEFSTRAEYNEIEFLRSGISEKKNQQLVNLGL